MKTSVWLITDGIATPALIFGPNGGSDLPALLSRLDVPTDDLQWLTLDPPRRRWAHAGLYSALKKAISAD